MMAYTYRMQKADLPRRGVVITLLFIGVVAASTGAIFIRFAQSEGVSSIFIATTRLLFASIILMPVIIIKYIPHIRNLRIKDWLFSLSAGFFLAVHFVFWVTSLEYTSIASSVLLVSTTPIWVILISSILFKERINKIFFLGLVCALSGSMIVSLSDVCSWNKFTVTCPQISELVQGKAILGDVLALLGAWAASGYLIIGKKVRSKLPLLPYVFIVYSVAAILLTIISLINKYPIFGLPSKVYIWLLLLALIPQLIGHTIFNWTLKYVTTSFVSISLLGEPLGSTFLAVLLFNEIPSWMKVPGFLLLFTGIWISGRYDSTKIPVPPK
jgi:drug/metabolite transporter (DMT)-like permease